MNVISISGRLTADPELKKTKDDISVAGFTVAVNRRTKDKKADFIRVKAWRQTADFVDKWFHKGDWIEVTGELYNDQYEDKNGNTRDYWHIEASNVGFGGSSKSDTQGTTPIHYIM